MTYEKWRDRLIADVENAAARYTESDVVDQGDAVTMETVQALQGLAERLRNLSPDDQRLRGLYAEELELAKVPERQFGEALNRLHDAREEVLRSVGCEHGPFESLDAFFGELRLRADEAITEFRMAGISA
jgi:hypothetical protein